jgi:hypothetical protein
MGLAMPLVHLMVRPPTCFILWRVENDMVTGQACNLGLVLARAV